MNCQQGDTIRCSLDANLKTDMQTSIEVVSANPESEILAKDQNKLIHLDPIPNFTDKAEIKPWLQKVFYPQGIEIVIERSDNIKVVFKCKAARRGKNTRDRSNIEAPEMENSETPSPGARQKKKRSVSRFNTCPFRIRATFSLKRKKWNIVVLNNSHSHPLQFNPDSEEYKKFKERLRETSDWDAVKQFDELEYRTMSNLPIRTSLIPCDCGLTNEIKSFNIVLPSTRSSSSNNLPTLPNASFCKDNTNSSSNTLQQVKKPKSKRIKQQQQRENLLKSTTTQNFLATGKTHSTKSSSISEFLDNTTSANANPGELLTLAPSGSIASDLDEIDFTNIFNKPLHHHHHSYHQHEEDNNINNTSNSYRGTHFNGYDDDSLTLKTQNYQVPHNSELQIDNSGHRYGSVLFSPHIESPQLYLSPSDEVLESPSNPRSSVTYQNSDNFFDFVEKSDLNLQYNSDRNLSRDAESFTDSLTGLNLVNRYQDNCSHLNSVATATNVPNDRDLNNILATGLNEIKMMSTDLTIANELRQQQQQEEQLHGQQEHFKGEIFDEELHEHENDVYTKDFQLNWNSSNHNLNFMSLPIEKKRAKKDDDNINNNEQNFWYMNFENS